MPEDKLPMFNVPTLIDGMLVGLCGGVWKLGRCSGGGGGGWFGGCCVCGVWAPPDDDAANDGSLDG